MRKRWMSKKIVAVSLTLVIMQSSYAAITHTLSIAPSDPNDNWSVDLAPAVTAEVTIEVGTEPCWIVSSGPTTNFIAATSGIVWVPVGSVIKVTNSGSGNESTVVKVSCSWTRGGCGTGGGSGTAVTINGLADAIANLLPDGFHLVWAFNPTVQLINQDIDWSVSLFSDAGGIGLANFSVCPTGVNPSSAGWKADALAGTTCKTMTVGNWTYTFAGVLGSTNASTGKLHADYTGIGGNTGSEDSVTALFFVQLGIEGPDKTLIYCEGEHPTITLLAQSQPPGGAYSWEINGNIVSVGDSDQQSVVIRGTSESNTQYDSTAKLRYTIGTGFCEDIQHITVQKPTSLSTPVVTAIDPTVFKWGYNYTFTVLDKFGDPCKPVGTAAPWWQETKTLCGSTVPGDEPPPDIGDEVDGNGQFTDTVAWGLSANPPEDYHMAATQSITIEGCEVGVRCLEWWHGGASSTAGACADCEE